jgi:hypothetical protein
MASQIESPATLAACGAPEGDLAGASIYPESKSPLIDIQARRLTRRCAISLAMAAVVAPLVFGEGS